MFNIDLDKTLEYKTRDGRLARVKSRVHRSILNHSCDGFFGSIDGIVSFWVPGGRVCNGTIEDHPADIIGPWVEPKKEPEVDWSKYPEHVKYLAMDANDIWHWFTQRPSKGCRGFTRAAGHLYAVCGVLPHEGYPKYYGPWEDSLCVRPGVRGR